MFTAGQIKMKLTKSKLREVIKEVLSEIYKNRSEGDYEKLGMMNLIQLASAMDTHSGRNLVPAARKEFYNLKNEHKNIIVNDRYLQRFGRTLSTLLGGQKKDGEYQPGLGEPGGFKIGPGHSSFIRRWVDILADRIEEQGENSLDEAIPQGEPDMIKKLEMAVGDVFDRGLNPVEVAKLYTKDMTPEDKKIWLKHFDMNLDMWHRKKSS